MWPERVDKFVPIIQSDNDGVVARRRFAEKHRTPFFESR
jgi:hypothetical protein